jgi:tetratricopeptide (TPR) repeat protein
VGVVQRLAATAPLLWIIEDLHWADRSTRDLLAFLATYSPVRSGAGSGHLPQRRAGPPAPLRGLLGELARNRRVVRLDLPRFTRAEVAEQLAGLLGADPPTRLVQDLYARSGGNPFFTEELVLAGDGTSPGALPPSLQEVLLARVVRLGDGTQQLLRVAAAAGPGVTQPLVAVVAGMGEAALLEGLREAVDQQLLVPEPGGDGYLFRHALLAEAVYGELLAGERVQLHTALAGALEAGLEAGGPPATRAARLAYHWAAAGDQPRALSASIQAAATAEQVYAFAEAQLQLECALALWDRVADTEARAGMDRVALLARCAEAAYAAGDPARAAQLVRQAIALIDQARQPQRAGLLHEQLARCLRRLGDPAALVAQQEAVRLVPPAPSAERARVLGSLAQLLVVVNRFEEARGLAEEAVAIAGQVGARVEEAIARTALGGALIYLGDPAAGLAELQEAVGLATEAGDVIVVLRAILNHSDGLLAAMDGLREARRLGLARSYGQILACNATEALFALGRWDQAEQVSHEILETAASDAASVNLLLARATLELGRPALDAAEARPRTAQRLLPAPISKAQTAGPLFCGLAELAVWRGDLDQARKLVAEAVPLVEADPRYAVPLFALDLRVEADRAELARARHPGQPAPDDATATALLERVQEAVEGPAAAGLPDLAAWHATALAERTRRPAPPTRPPGQRRSRRGSGSASPTGPPTPASATPRRSWPPATATAPRWCWVAPPPSPAASAPACSTAKCRPWHGVPASTSARPPKPPGPGLTAGRGRVVVMLRRAPTGSSASWLRPPTPWPARVGLRQAARQLGIHRDAFKARSSSGACRRWSGGWAGSPAASWPTAPRPNAPTSWPSGSAASTPPPNSSGPPGRRCARPSLVTALACPPATAKPSASAPSPRPASRAARRPRRPWTRCSWPSTPASSPPVVARRQSRGYGCAGPRRSRRSATARWWSSTPRAGWPPSGGWPPSPAAPTRPTPGRGAGRASRAPAGRPRQPHPPNPPAGEGDGY